MDISKASTEAYRVLLRNHERTVDTVQLATAALSLLTAESQRAGGADAVARLVNGAHPQWNKPGRAFPNSGKGIATAQAHLSNLVVVRSLSTLDVYIRDALLDLCRFSPSARSIPGFPGFQEGAANGAPAPCADAVSAFMKSMSFEKRVRAAWTVVGETMPKEVRALMPLFRYFRLSRNRIAHFGEVAGPQLERYAASAAVNRSLQKWYARGKKAGQPLPTLKAGQEIVFEPHHAILASAVCQTIARAHNDLCARLLGAEGLTRLAAHSALHRKSHPARAGSQRSAGGAVVQFLRARYRVKNATVADVQRVLHADGAWDAAVERHRELYLAGKRPRGAGPRTARGNRLVK